MSVNSFDAQATLTVGDESYEIFRLDAVEGAENLPFSLKVLLENLLRTEDGANITADEIRALAGWDPSADPSEEIQFTPARVIMQDFTGVPCVVDLATMREAMADLGGDPTKINPLAPAEMVIDHSVIADVFGTADAFVRNVEIEYGRNRERYQFLRWGQTAFDDFKVVPPGTGIVHQVNIEHLARVIFSRPVSTDDVDGKTYAYPDTCVGHRLPHHDGQRSGRGRLGRGRHRGRGGHARPAGVDAHSAGRGVQAVRRAAGGCHRDRPGADHHRDAAPAQGGRQVRRVLRAGRLPGAAGQPGHDRQHEPGVRVDHRGVPDRRQDHRLPAADRPQRGADRARRGVREGAGSVARRRPGAEVLRVPRARPGQRGAQHRRSEAAAGPGHPGPRQAGVPGGAARLRRRRGHRRLRRVGGGVLPGLRRAQSRQRQRVGRPARVRRGRTRRHRPAQQEDPDHPGRPGGRDRPRRGHHRRDHLLHQHLQPERDDRRRAGGQEGRGAGSDPQALGEDHAGAGVEGGQRLLRPVGPDAVPGQARLQPRRVRLHHVHRQLRAVDPRGQRGGPGRTTWPWSRCCRATGTSRAGSTPTSR